MSARTGRNGAITKPSASSRRPNLPQAGAGRAPLRNPPSQSEYVKEDSFVATSVYHQPWERHNKDSHYTIGAFPTEEEAMRAGYKHYMDMAGGQADGWEDEWKRNYAGELRLVATNDIGEDDTEAFTVTIKKCQQERKRVVERAVEPPRPMVVENLSPVDRYVYVVKEEQRVCAEGEDVYEGDLQDVKNHGVFNRVVDANLRAEEIYEEYLEDSETAQLLDDGLGKNLVAAVVVDPEEEMAYLVSVERFLLK